MTLYQRAVKLAKTCPHKRTKKALDKILLEKVSFDLNQELGTFGLAEEVPKKKDVKKELAKYAAYHSLKYAFSYPVRTFLSRLISYAQDVIAAPLARKLEKDYHIPSFLLDAAFFYLGRKLNDYIVSDKVGGLADKVLKPAIYGESAEDEVHSLSGIKLASVPNIKALMGGFMQWIKDPRKALREMKPFMTDNKLDRKKFQRALTLRNMQTLSRLS